MVKSILFLGNEELRRVCTPVEDFEDESFKELVDNLTDTFSHDSTFVGMAASQIGGEKRVICVLFGENMRIVMVNPEIVERSDYRVSDNEACLSIPNVAGQVWRSGSVTLKFQDVKGQEMIMRFDGGSARVIQHEIDHLDGVLFLDRVEQKKALMISDLTRKKCMVPVKDIYNKFGAEMPARVAAAS